MSFVYIISWVLAISLHFNNIKLSALKDIKELTIKLIYEIIDEHKRLQNYNEKADDPKPKKRTFIVKSDKEKSLKNENTLRAESIFSHKISRIERKISEINSIYRDELISLKEEKIKKLFVIDFSNEKIDNIEQACYDAVEYIDLEFHSKIHSKRIHHTTFKYELFFISTKVIFFNHIINNALVLLLFHFNLLETFYSHFF